MSKRFGGKFGGFKMLKTSWNSIRTQQTAVAPQKPTELDYTDVGGLWTLDSTTQFKKTQSGVAPYTVHHTFTDSAPSSSTVMYITNPTTIPAGTPILIFVTSRDRTTPFGFNSIVDSIGTSYTKIGEATQTNNLTNIGAFWGVTSSTFSAGGQWTVSMTNLGDSANHAIVYTLDPTGSYTPLFTQTPQSPPVLEQLTTSQGYGSPVFHVCATGLGSPSPTGISAGWTQDYSSIVSFCSMFAVSKVKTSQTETSTQSFANGNFSSMMVMMLNFNL